MSTKRKQKLLNRKNQRTLKKRQIREATRLSANEQKLHEYIEKMLAAYKKETDIPAAAACLVHEITTTKSEDDEGVTTTKQTRYWFEHHEERAKIVDAHPDVQYLFELVYDLWRAHKLEDGRDEKLNEGLKLLSEFMKKYDTQVNKEIDEEIAKIDKEVEDA